MSNIFRRAILITVAGACLALQNQNPVKAWEVSRGPVSPAIAPGLPGAPGHPGESRVRIRTQQLCAVRNPDGRISEVKVLESEVEVVEPSTVRQRGVSGGLSLFSWGASLGVNSLNMTPNAPHEKFREYLLEAEASQVVSCEALTNGGLHQERVESSLRTLQILRRGRLSGFSASEAAQDAYNKARIQAPHHPNLAAARAAAAEGRYEEAIRLLTTH